MQTLELAAKSGSSFWPTGVIMLIVIVVISGGVGLWRNSKIKKGKKT